MDASNWINLVLLIFTALTALFTASQASQAKRNSKAAEDAVKEARRAADVAEQQLALERADRQEALKPKVRTLVHRLYAEGNMHLFTGSFVEMKNVGDDVVHIESVKLDGRAIPFEVFDGVHPSVHAAASVGPEASSMILMARRNELSYLGGLTHFDTWKPVEVRLRNDADGLRYVLRLNIKVPETGIIETDEPSVEYAPVG